MSPSPSPSRTTPEPSWPLPATMSLEDEVTRYLNDDSGDDEPESNCGVGIGHRPQSPSLGASSPWDTDQATSTAVSEASHELSTSSRRNEVSAVARYARHHKLDPYQTTEVEKLVTVSLPVDLVAFVRLFYCQSPLAVQLGTIFTELLAMKNQLKAVVSDQPPFTIGDPLMVSLTIPFVKSV